jgi:capsular exopolysaccharide synthesis family protein
VTLTQTLGTPKFPSGHGSPDRKGLDVGKLSRKVLRRAHIVLALVVVGLLLGHEALKLVQPRYTSPATVLLDPKRPGSFGAESEFANLYVDNAKVSGVLAIMQSADLLQHVVDSQHLADDPEFADAKPSAIVTLLSRLHILPAPPAEVDTPEIRRLRAVGRLARAIRITRVGMTYAVEVEATASTGPKAQRLAQALIDAYLEDQSELKAGAAKRDYAWLTDRLSKVRDDLSRSEEEVEAIRRKFDLPEATSASGGVDQQTVSGLNTQLLMADADVAARRARYEEAERIRKSGGDLGALSEAVASRTIEDLRKQQTDARRHLADLVTHYTPAYPELIQTQRDLRLIDSAIDAETTRIVTNLLDEYESAAARRQALADDLARRARDASGDDKSEGRVQLRDAQRVVDANRGLYNAFLGKLQDVEQQLSRHDPEARILSPAAEPDAPSFPKPIMFFGGGGAVGMLAGLGLVLLIPMRESGYTSINDAESKLSLPVLGAVPLLPRQARNARRSPTSIVDYVVTRSLSQFSECLRALRIALHIGSLGGPRVIQLTSAVAGEGKSSLAATLAVSAALSGIRTALIEADVRRPSISGLFGLQDCLGLTDILQDNVPYRDAVQKHRGLPLSIITAGTVPSPAPDIVASQSFADLIRQVAREHDLVILDSPPVLAVSDPLVIAKVVDATVLVVESRATPQLAVDHALKALRVARAPLVGVVLNKADLSRASQYSYGNGAYGSYRPILRKLS